MRAALRLPVVGFHIARPRPTAMARYRWMPHVARVVGRDQAGAFILRPVRLHLDFTESNASGSAGVFAVYWLAPGAYWVREPVGYNATDSYYIEATDDGRIERVRPAAITREMMRCD